MMRAANPLPERRRLLAMPIALVLALMVGMDRPKAHNNPGFKEVLLLTIEVTAEPLSEGAFAVHSEAFSLDLPKKTIELIWKIADGAGDTVTFAVAQGDALHAEGLADGANSRVVRGDDIRIADVAGASGPFSIEIYANVIDRSKPAES